MIRAFVFDLDGTLVETEELKALSYARAAAELCPDLNEGEVIGAFKDLVGLSRQEVAVGLMHRFALEGAARDRIVEFRVATPWQAYVQIRLSIYETRRSPPWVLSQRLVFRRPGTSIRCSSRRTIMSEPRSRQHAPHRTLL